MPVNVIKFQEQRSSSISSGILQFPLMLGISYFRFVYFLQLSFPEILEEQTIKVRNNFIFLPFQPIHIYIVQSLDQVISIGNKSHVVDYSASKIYFPGPVCWKRKTKSYDRGPGTVPSRCPSDRPDYYGGLCYKRCRSGYKRFGCCLCKIIGGLKSYGRGAGTVPQSSCPSTRPHKQGGLCYKSCRADYTGVSSYAHWVDLRLETKTVGCSGAGTFV